MDDFKKKYICELKECMTNSHIVPRDAYELMRRCLNIFGKDFNIDENIFYWKDYHVLDDLKMMVDILEYNFIKANGVVTSKSELTEKNKIFISHSSKDDKIARILARYLVDCGAPRDSVFLSSLPGNDVNFEISKEVKENLRASSLNIVLLSSHYYKSAYCQNEAGIIWYLDVPKVVIALPEITTQNMQGFLNSENKIRRLDNKDDMLSLAKIIGEKYLQTPISPVMLNEYVDDLIDVYRTCVNQKGTTVRDTNILVPDVNGYYTATIVEERFANANYRCLKINGLLPTNSDYMPNETHWLFFNKVLFTELKKGDKVKFLPSEIKPIRHFSDLKNTRNIYVSNLEIL